MFWLSKVFAPAVLVIGIAGSAVVVMAQQDGADDNQPPFGKGGPAFGKGQPPFGKGKGEDKKGDKKGDRKGEERKFEEKKFERKGDERGASGPKGPAPKSDAVVDAWVATLLSKITDPHDTVRDSARGALVAVGPAALPALQKLADGDDPAKAVAARKLIGAIHGRGPGGPAAGPSGRGGRGGFGPGEPGGRGGFSGPAGPGGRGGFGFGAPGGFGPGGRGPGGPGGQPGMRPGGRGPGGPGGERRPGREEEEQEFEIAPQPRVLAIH
ncbi:hypothetical protein GobsT_04160 [Gemmata obscuriglobus]|uniref:HEAT repeat domain-containing protein n=1 Tax=Gemmata obscuriglobus TaxID=114 RepID=A0A2Z3H7Z6_9BACT|nr:hypothetical protein [Gemmata obscuriglobus]AWM40991.1 hypothetical protein C1280_31090 [Gemmata obscuriglobus]QEG25689.1 hypothetical protein GobsT_04160 [Gemmata obscuriglobus]VTR99341.1 unnamed protein product [Gemmata obscuriglobus UQM 2246]